MSDRSPKTGSKPSPKSSSDQPSRKYQKPQIIRVGHPFYAKHGWTSSQSVPVLSEIDGISVSQLLEQFGSPLFVFSERTLIQKFTEAKKAFEERYPKVTFGWSYKTNYLRSICKLFHQQGALAEVVSDFEYEQARSLGVPGENIIFNGPLKPLSILRRAVSENARIHIDSLDELNDLELIARETGKTPNIAIRVNLAVDGLPPWSRFGFNYENDEAWHTLERIFQRGLLNLSGLHTHLGTFILDPNAYKMAVIKLVELVERIHKTYKKSIDYLDLGGGFPSLNHLKGIYQAPEVAVPPIEAYAEAISTALRAHWPTSELPQLIIESGRHLIDEAGYLISSVVSSKLLPDSRRAYVLDAGVNLLYTSTWYQPKIYISEDLTLESNSPKSTSLLAAPSVLLGPLCMNIDVIRESIMMPRLPRFQPLILHPVGAYNVTQWMQFIQYRPAVVLITTQGQPQLIRKRETLEAMNACEPKP